MAELGHQYGGEDKVQWNLGQVRGKRQRTSYEIMLSRLHCGFNLNSSVHIYLFVSAALKRYHLSLSEKEKRRQKGVDESHTQSMRRQGRCRHVSSTFTIGLTTSPPRPTTQPPPWGPFSMSQRSNVCSACVAQNQIWQSLFHMCSMGMWLC